MRLIDADALNRLLLKEGAVEGSVIVMMVKSMKTIDPVKRGHWMPHKMRDGTPMERCDACGGLAQMMFDYCPNCGAWMYVRRG